MAIFAYCDVSLSDFKFIMFLKSMAPQRNHSIYLFKQERGQNNIKVQLSRPDSAYTSLQQLPIVQHIKTYYRTNRYRQYSNNSYTNIAETDTASVTSVIRSVTVQGRW